MKANTRARAADIAAHVAAFLGALNVLGVLAFHFPQYLTTPEIRASYDPDHLRLLLSATMLASVVCGFAAIIGRQFRRVASTGIALTFVSLLLGGPFVPVDDFPSGTPFVGLDWLVLDLLFSALVFIVIEKAIPHRPGPILRPEWRLDLTHFGVNHLAIGVSLLATNVVATRLFSAARNPAVVEVVTALPFLVELGLAILAADLIQYAVHRAMHEVPWLWRVHLVHHSPEHMDWLSGSRIHLIELLLTRTLVFVPIFVLGFSKEVIDAYIVIVGLQGVFNHANVELPFGPLARWLVTPQFHHWHHASDPEAIDRNYAAHLAFLDDLFGTRVKSTAPWPKAYGLVGKRLQAGYLAHLVAPFE